MMKAIESRRNPQNPKFRQWKVLDEKETVKITKSREGQATSSGKVKSDDFEKIQNSMQGLELEDDMFLGNLSANFGMDHDADLLALEDAASEDKAREKKMRTRSTQKRKKSPTRRRYPTTAQANTYPPNVANARTRPARI